MHPHPQSHPAKLPLQSELCLFPFWWCPVEALSEEKLKDNIRNGFSHSFIQLHSSRITFTTLYHNFFHLIQNTLPFLEPILDLHSQLYKTFLQTSTFISLKSTGIPRLQRVPASVRWDQNFRPRAAFHSALNSDLFCYTFMNVIINWKTKVLGLLRFRTSMPWAMSSPFSAIP